MPDVTKLHVVPIKPEVDEELVQYFQEFVDLAKQGKIHMAAVVTQGIDGYIRSSVCCDEDEIFTLVGGMEYLKKNMLAEFMVISTGEMNEDDQ